MKLQAPFKWKDRQPAWEAPVLFVPEYYDAHEDFVCPPLFEKEAPLWVEYCSGNGEWIVEKALRFPEINWVAVEKRFDRVRKIWARAKKAGLKNLAIVSGEALPFSNYYLQKASVAKCFINFPDPWPKRRHAKHRLFSAPFIEALQRILLPGAEVMVATDDALWAGRILNQFLELGSGFDSNLAEPGFVTSWPEYGTSFFEQLWRSKGKTIHYLQFVKKS